MSHAVIGPEFRREYRRGKLHGFVRELNPDATGRHVFLWICARPTGKAKSGVLAAAHGWLAAERVLLAAMATLRGSEV